MFNIFSSSVWIVPARWYSSEYIKNIISSEELRIEYDTKLLDSATDAVKAYQMNNVNNSFRDISTQRVEDIEASVKVFYNSLSTTFDFIRL